MQCRLSEVAPVRARGFDYTVQGAYAVASGVSKILGIFIHHRRPATQSPSVGQPSTHCGSPGLENCHTGKDLPLRTWLRVAFEQSLLARHGITGPLEVIEGDKGLMDAITGCFQINWPGEGLGCVGRTTVKKYDAEIHSQTAIEAVLMLRSGSTSFQALI